METRGTLSRAGSLAALVLAATGVLSPTEAVGQEAGETGPERPRAREAGVLIGRLPTGPLNAITDVPGVRVGHHTVWVGDSIRTGVTAILPHGDNVFERRVRAAIAVGNGFGKLVGLSQVNELGELETPILLTGTLSVFRAADALLDTILSLPANRDVRSMNPVVGETNDGYLSDMRVRPIRPEHVRGALGTAASGPVEEGAVGAGTGTIAFGWKGGIGTSSRRVEVGGRIVNIGVLVQSNFGGSLRIDGVRVGEKLAAAGLRGGRAQGDGDGSVMIVIATDLPLAHRELDRVADRAFMGLARTGSYMSHGSGDYAIAFSTGEGPAVRDGGSLSRVFEAVVEATDEAVINSLFRATSVTGRRGRTIEALPLEPTLGLLREAGVLGTPR
ncbi:P1 family peptidase [Candidatus Palauibacter sp.]|uniref:DmpA family aminopeptidase n=1 Tax=Candidatus Palauibacter sp. TaxID=3101350 RepID=UPI003B523E2E